MRLLYIKKLLCQGSKNFYNQQIAKGEPKTIALKAIFWYNKYDKKVNF